MSRRQVKWDWNMVLRVSRGDLDSGTSSLSPSLHLSFLPLLLHFPSPSSSDFLPSVSPFHSPCGGFSRGYSQEDKRG